MSALSPLPANTLPLLESPPTYFLGSPNPQEGYGTSYDYINEANIFHQNVKDFLLQSFLNGNAPSFQRGSELSENEYLEVKEQARTLIAEKNFIQECYELGTRMNDLLFEALASPNAIPVTPVQIRKALIENNK